MCLEVFLIQGCPYREVSLYVFRSVLNSGVSL